MGLLNGGLKRGFGELFEGHYLDARVVDRELTYGNDGTLQAGADPKRCKARVDSATQRMREAEGFTETDRAIFILASSITVPIDTDTEVEILEGDYAGSIFGIASIDRPPGASYWLCRGTRRGAS